MGKRPNADQLLRQIQSEEAEVRRGRLKVFLGYASGVGKSFRMLDEGRRRQQRGQDVVVGAIQSQTSPAVEALLKTMEVIPLKAIGETQVMDVDSILRRTPRVCLVDGLAYDNPPRSGNLHRWQDVNQLLDCGVSVITTINLQYVAERQQEVERIRGKHVDVTVPESFLRTADEVVVVDTPAEYCILQRAPADTAVSPEQHQQRLSQLREIALLLAADVVDSQLESYLEQQGVTQLWGTQERILVCLTPKANAVRMIERARIVRDRFHGELFAIYVGQRDLSADDQIALEQNLGLARQAGAEVKLLEGEDAVATILHFSRQHGITQIFIGHSLSDTWKSRLSRSIVDRLLQQAEGMDLKLFPH